MGLMDKVKAQATVLAQKTQDTAREGKARLDQAQAARHADVMLRNLGALVYAEQTGRAAPDSAEQVARLVAQIQAHEAENGISLAAQPIGWIPGGGVAGQSGVPSQGGPGGPDGAGVPGQDDAVAAGQPGSGAPEPGGPGQQPFGEPGPGGPGAPGQQPFGGPQSGTGFTQPDYTFPPPPSGDDPSSYPPEPGTTPSS
jgi:hypothetical protein